MESNEMKLQEILKARGITEEQLKEVQEQEIPAAAESFQRIMDIYYLLKVTADGRLAGTTYSDGSVSAAAGTDKNGVYALFESATVYDHSQNQNAQMNLKLHPSAVQGVQGTRKLLELVRTYMRKGGFHVQFNVVSSDTLRDAQKSPDQYRDLMVRVAGFTQYWCEIGKPIQDEVIFRTEYEEA